ncbi:hypothetical protein PVAP13_5NG191843 [Panicum virgatum]|uniref:Uncharacterized protein n=1 Tax=Panicum virgatum TaxID=38727 RepID=A0A8T0RU02_PANVG|nr:hypothetical protein PVAP13_5NG191843 [Panicum virgatum]
MSHRTDPPTPAPPSRTPCLHLRRHLRPPPSPPPPLQPPFTVSPAASAFLGLLHLLRRRPSLSPPPPPPSSASSIVLDLLRRRNRLRLLLRRSRLRLRFAPPLPLSSSATAAASAFLFRRRLRHFCLRRSSSASYATRVIIIARAINRPPLDPRAGALLRAAPNADAMTMLLLER